MDAYDIELKETSIACPEQYDAIDTTTGEVVGYLRLRNGHFTVEVPDAGGVLVYESYPRGDGAFDNNERDGELEAAIAAIVELYQE